MRRMKGSFWSAISQHNKKGSRTAAGFYRGGFLLKQGLGFAKPGGYLDGGVGFCAANDLEFGRG